MKSSAAISAAAVVAALSGCAGSGGTGAAPAAPASSGATAAAAATPTATASATATARHIRSASPRVTGAASTAPVRVTRHAATAAAVTVAPRAATASSPVDHLRGVGNAQQVVVAEASGYGTSYATLSAYQKRSSGWVRVFGPWTARIGYNGFAPPGHKREGDGRTPTGSYGFSFFFGVDPRPSGIHFSWRHAYTYDVWDDDPSSSRYNLWTDKRRYNPGRDPEPMHAQPSYNYGAVIAYNTARQPGLGSAIFFHVSHGSATAGCVAVPQADVLKVLRWLVPSESPRIIMGTRSAITH